MNKAQSQHLSGSKPSISQSGVQPWRARHWSAETILGDVAMEQLGIKLGGCGSEKLKMETVELVGLLFDILFRYIFTFTKNIREIERSVSTSPSQAIDDIYIY